MLGLWTFTRQDPPVLAPILPCLADPRPNPPMSTSVPAVTGFPEPIRLEIPSFRSLPLPSLPLRPARLRRSPSASMVVRTRLAVLSSHPETTPAAQPGVLP